MASDIIVTSGLVCARKHILPIQVVERASGSRIQVDVEQRLILERFLCTVGTDTYKPADGSSEMAEYRRSRVAHLPISVKCYEFPTEQ